MSGARGPGLPGRVVAGHGRRVVVEDEDGRRKPCVVRGHTLRVVCGDRVRWEPQATGSDGIVIALESRSNALARPERRGRSEPIAANISQLVTVFAPRPPPDPFLVDRYLAAAELLPCKALLLYHKSDLAGAQELAPWAVELEGVGYRLLRTSVREDGGLHGLEAALEGHTTILVGQSGVGKSSLLNALVPGLDTATAALSAATGHGMHTTSAAVLHRLPRGGAIIDSPGVRDYTPEPIAPREVVRGFVDLLEPALECRFADCMHRDEPDCGVKQAVATGRVSSRRYESYLHLLRLMESLEQTW